MDDIIDCLIIGGGPAGLTAGLYASRGGLNNVVMLDKGMPGGQITGSSEIENYPGVDGEITGMELMDPWLAQSQKFGMKFEMSPASYVVKQDNLFIVNLEDGRTLQAKSVIVCTGSSPKKANIKGEDTYFGRGVSTCATCDGFFYKNREVAVLGGGDAALEEALYLSKLCSKVYMIVRKDVLRAAPNTVERVLKKENIEILYNTTIKEILGDSTGLTGLDLGDRILTVPGLFVFIGHNINNAVIRKGSKFSCEVNGDGAVAVDLKMRTSVPGLFAAGDIRVDAPRQVVCAASDGAIAALSAIEYLDHLENSNQL